MSVRPPDAERIRDLVRRFAHLPILVVGDVMLDRFIVGRVTRISPEAPVPIVHFEAEHVRLGGAANVAHNIAALGGRPMLVGLVGKDAAADRIRQELRAAEVGVEGLIEDESRPTTEKVRTVTERNQQVARVDYEIETDAAGEVERAIVQAVGRLGHDARTLLVSDYSKGAVTRPVVEALFAVGGSAGPPAGSRVPAIPVIPVIVDPKIPHLAFYRGATLVTPNHHEAEVATHRRIRTDADARDAAHDFRRRVGCDAVLITRGEYGMWLSSADSDEAIAASAREVSDVTGAGDTVVATLALALGAGATMAEAAVLANHAAGIVVGKFGAATVTREELTETF